MCIIAANNRFKAVSCNFLKIKNCQTFFNLSTYIGATPHRTIATVLVWSCDKNVLQTNSKATNGKRYIWRPRTLWRAGVAGDWDALKSQLELLPPQPQKDKQVKGNTLNLFNVFPKMIKMIKNCLTTGGLQLSH